MLCVFFISMALVGCGDCAAPYLCLLLLITTVLTLSQGSSSSSSNSHTLALSTVCVVPFS